MGVWGYGLRRGWQWRRLASERKVYDNMLTLSFENGGIFYQQDTCYMPIYCLSNINLIQRIIHIYEKYIKIIL